MTKKVVTNDGKKGGWLVGKRHYDKDGKPLGGIKAVVTDAGGKPVELEGGEVIINREASKKYWKELSKINQSAGNGVPIEPPTDAFDEDPAEDYENGGKIEFNANHIPNKWILNYAIKLKDEHPDVWALGGNIFGNQAFINLKRVAERGHWLDSEEWMYKKWRSFVARHKGDFRIQGVIAMLKWVDKVDKGWQYMKNLIEEEINKREARKSKKMNDGGNVSKTPAPKSEQIKGSKTNTTGTAKDSKSGASINFDEKTLASIKLLIDSHNEKYPSKKITLGVAKAVVRRGMGAYSSTHRPTINGGKPNSRTAWGLARLKAFIYKAEKGKSKSKKYSQDNDLFDDLAIKVSKYIDGGLLAKNLIEKSKEISNKNEYLNCDAFCHRMVDNKLFKSEFEIVPFDLNFDENFESQYNSLIKVLNVGDIVAFGEKDNVRHYSIYLGNDDVIEVEMWGGKPRIHSLKDNLYNYENVSYIYREKKYAEGGLIAPNGKPSKLTVEQYELVRTPKFKAWFGDWENDPANASKVVDENGEPKVMYRGNPQEQVDLGYTFNLGYNFLNKKTKNNFGFFFTDNLDIAHRYMKVSKWGEIQGGSVTQVFLNIKNLFDLTPLDLFTDGETFSNYLVSSGLKTKGYKELIKRISEYRYYEHKEQANVYGFFDKFPSLNTFFIYNKIDGVVFKEMSRAKFPYSTYVVFNSNQIKLADGSNTTFDSNNPDIRFAKGGGIEKEIPVRVDYLEQQLFENNKDIQVPNSVYKEYLKSGKVPKNIVDDLSSKIDEKHWIETTPLSVHLTPLNKMAKGGLIAPNGKLSNLTPEQYKLVRTPEFKAWFGDWENDPKNASKVVDENGEPLVVYRGDSSASKKGFIFKTGFNRMSYISKDRLPNQYFHYFVDNYDVALGYGQNQIEDHNEKVAETGKGKLWEAKVTPYFLNIKNPIDITPNNSLFPTFTEYEKLQEKINGKAHEYRNSYDYGFYITQAELNKILENKLGADYLENTKETAELYSRVDEWAKESFRKSSYPEKTFAYFIEYKGSNSKSDILRRIYIKMLKNNVDGMVFLESTNWKTDFFENWRKYESGELKYDSKRWVEKPKVFAALESNQIKLADGTNIKFDSENPDIRFEEGGNVDAKDSVTIDIPLMIRLLELSREDVKSDAELHFVVENLLKLKNKPVLTMDDYAFIADVEHNHLKKYDLGGKMPESEKRVDLGFGGLGNGTTVWDRNRIHNNDYKIVAHISNEGKITYYDKKLPEYAINQIESMAENEKKRYEDMNGLSTGYDFNPIQTPLN